jgi:hypothetical protein
LHRLGGVPLQGLDGVAEIAARSHPDFSSSDSAPAAGCSRQESPAAGGSLPFGKAEA